MGSRKERRLHLEAQEAQPDPTHASENVNATLRTKARWKALSECLKICIMVKHLPRLNELEVAFDMDEVEMVEEEPWDDNDSDLDADFDSGASEDE